MEGRRQSFLHLPEKYWCVWLGRTYVCEQGSQLGVVGNDLTLIHGNILTQECFHQLRMLFLKKGNFAIQWISLWQSIITLMI